MDGRYGIIVRGDKEIGKTAMIQRYLEKKFVDYYDPTIGEDCLEKHHRKSGLSVTVIDNECYSSNYMEMNVTLLVFSFTSRVSFDSVQKHKNSDYGHKPNTNVIVGTKSDLKDLRQIDKEELKELADVMGCKYFICSSLTGKNVEEIFEYAINIFQTNR